MAHPDPAGQWCKALADRMMMLDPSPTLLGTSIREIRETCCRPRRVGAQDVNPLQSYCSAEESTTALQAVLAVVEHNLPGFESHQQHLQWPRLTAQSLLQLNALPTSLRNSADRLSLGADSRVIRLPALIRLLYNRSCPVPWSRTRTGHGGR